MLVLLILAFPMQHNNGQASTDTEELDRVVVMERIARVSPEGHEVIERVKRMTPVIQKNRSGKPLGEAIEDSINGRGQFIIDPVGWEAVKSDGPRWKVSFYFQDQAHKYQKATWEYNQDRNVLLPAEFTNATKFWVRRSENLNP